MTKNNETVGYSNAIYIPQSIDKGGFSMVSRKEKLNVKGLLLGITLASFFIIITMLGLVKYIGGQVSLVDNIEYITVSVSSGDTVWDLIQENNPEYNGDIRQLVHYTKERNGGINLIAGGLVEIPVVKEVK